MRQAIGVCVGALVLAAGCATTKVESSWMSPDAAPVKQVLVVAASGTPAARRTFEQTLAEDLRARGVRAVGLSERFPDTARSHDRHETRDQVEALVRDEGFDSVLVGELVDKKTHVEAVPGPSMGIYGYWDTTYPVARETPTIDESTEWLVETRLFESAGGEPRLAWSVRSSSFDPGSATKMIRELSAKVVEHLGDDGLLPKRPAT